MELADEESVNKILAIMRGTRYERCDSASVFTCCFPGLYVILKSKRVRNWAPELVIDLVYERSGSKQEFCDH